MAFGKPVTDNEVLKSVNRKLMQRATGAGTKVTATVAGGCVTMSGVIGQEFQRRTLISAVSGINGVKRVVDNMTVTPAKKREF